METVKNLAQEAMGTADNANGGPGSRTGAVSIDVSWPIHSRLTYHAMYRCSGAEVGLSLGPISYRVQGCFRSARRLLEREPKGPGRGYPGQDDGEASAGDHAGG